MAVGLTFPASSVHKAKAAAIGFWEGDYECDGGSTPRLTFFVQLKIAGPNVCVFVTLAVE